MRGEMSTPTTDAPSSTRIALCELARTAADLEHGSRPEICDGLEQELESIRTVGPSIRSAAAHEPRLGRVFVANELRVVQRHSSMTRPGRRFPGDLPPSHAFTVAPTSPNSPSSWIRPAAFRPAAYASKQRVLAGVVGRLGRRIAAVIRRDDQEVARLQRLEDVRQAPVEVLQAAVEVHRVVAVAPEHVGLDEIHEHEPAVDVLEQLDRAVDAVDVRLRRKRVIDVAAGEDVEDLPDAVDRVSGIADEREVVRAPRLEREVVSVRRALVVARARRRTAAR